jgi:environmental stress-induced protein Ves
VTDNDPATDSAADAASDAATAAAAATDPAADAAGSSTPELLRADQHRRMPWRNGGGITYEVASRPVGSGLDDFDWRISFAEITEDGPFSAFGEVERTIVIVEGTSMRLTVDGEVHDLQRYEPLRFDGGSASSGQLTAGPVTDLNLMTRRGRAAAELELVQAEPGGSVNLDATAQLVLVALAGQIVVAGEHGDGATLQRRDAILWPKGRAVTVAGTGMLAVIRLRDAVLASSP